MAKYILKQQLGVKGRRCSVGEVFDAADIGDEASISALIASGVIAEEAAGTAPVGADKSGRTNKTNKPDDGASKKGGKAPS